MAELGNGYYPTHPGEILKEEIVSRGLSQRQLAKEMGMSYTVLNEILNARRPLTPSSALMIEATLGVDADTLMRIQTKYNMHTARNDKELQAKIMKLRKIVAVL
jgi:addiction module HigA family antidote